MTDKSLAQKVAERKNLLKKIASFVSEVCFERGKKLEYEECSTHTRGKYELKDFFGFSFVHQWSWRDNYDVYFNYNHGLRLVLQFMEQEGCYEVLYIDDNPSWLGSLKKLMSSKSKMIESAERRKKRLAEKEERDAKKKEKMLKIQHEANLLGL